MIENSFDPRQDYLLQNDRVLIRPLKESDYENLLSFSLQEPEIWNYSLVSAAGEENLRSYISKALVERERGRQYCFIVYDKEKSRYAGSTRFCEIDLQSQCLQMGYTWYGRHFHGGNLNTNCKLLLLEFAFQTMKMERVEFRVDVENQRGIAALEKLGSVREGQLRKCGPPGAGGSRRDCFVYGLLRDEWNEGVRQRLETSARISR